MTAFPAECVDCGETVPTGSAAMAHGCFETELGRLVDRQFRPLREVHHDG